MSRPKGSKNKKKKLGRPKGSKEVKKVVKKKKLGRPKVSKKVKKPKKIKKIKKKKLGRPKGSKKVKKTTVSKMPKKRGRPSGSRNKNSSLALLNKPEHELPKAYRLMGYCSKCNLMVGSHDLVSKFIYVCSGCNKRASIKTLKDKRKTSTYKNKQEYLDVAVVNPSEMAPMNQGHDVKSIKVDI